MTAAARRTTHLLGTARPALGHHLVIHAPRPFHIWLDKSAAPAACTHIADISWYIIRQGAFCSCACLSVHRQFTQLLAYCLPSSHRPLRTSIPRPCHIVCVHSYVYTLGASLSAQAHLALHAPLPSHILDVDSMVDTYYESYLDLSGMYLSWMPFCFQYRSCLSVHGQADSVQQPLPASSKPTTQIGIYISPRRPMVPPCLCVRQLPQHQMAHQICGSPAATVLLVTHAHAYPIR